MGVEDSARNLFTAEFGVVFGQGGVVELHFDGWGMSKSLAVELGLKEVQARICVGNLVRTWKIANVFDGLDFLFGNRSFVLARSQGESVRRCCDLALGDG